MTNHTPGPWRVDVSGLVMLRIQSLIADKEMVTAQANRDISMSGEWQCDYTEWYRQIDDEIKRLFDQFTNN